MDQDPDAIRILLEKRFPDGFTLRDEANAIVAYAFRNGPIEDLHAGEPSQLLEDPRLSRITDDEMKNLMLNACEAVEQFLQEKEADPDVYQLKMIQCNLLYCRGWDR